MDLLALASTRLDLVRLGLLAAALPEQRLRLVAYLRAPHAFDRPDLERLALQELTSYLRPAKQTAPGRLAEAMAWADECLARPRPDLLLLGEATEASLPFAVTAQKLGIAVASLEAGLPAAPEREGERRITEQLATFRFAPTAQAVGWLQERGLACHYRGDLLAEAGRLLTEEDVTTALSSWGLSRRGYLVLALREEPSAVPQAGMPVVYLPDTQGQALPTAGAWATEARPVAAWLSLLLGCGCLVSDDLGLCRIAAAAGAAALLLDPTGEQHWCADIPNLAPIPDLAAASTCQPDPAPPPPPAPRCAPAIAHILTRGA